MCNILQYKTVFRSMRTVLFFFLISVLFTYLHVLFLLLSGLFSASVKGIALCVWCQNVHTHKPIVVCTREAVNAFAALFTLFILYVNTSALISPSACPILRVYKCAEAGAKLYMHNITGTL